MSALFSLFGLIVAGNDGAQDIAFPEVPRPLTYQLEMRGSCAAKQYVLTIEVQTASSSRVIAAKIEGNDVVFQSPDGDLASAVSNFGVEGLAPIACDPDTGTLSISVRGYSPTLDALEGHSGEVVRSFSAP